MSESNQWEFTTVSGFEPEPIPEDVVEQPADVESLGALCSLRPNDGPDQQSFSVAEFATLVDGRRVILHNERGFTVGWGGSGGDDIRAALSEEGLVSDVLNVVLPDDDESPDEHTWPWLAKLARARGLEVTEAELRRMEYEVVLAPEVLDWLYGGQPV